MPRSFPNFRYKRRKILQWAGLAAGAAVFPCVYQDVKQSLIAAQAKYTDASRIVARPRPTDVSRVVLVHSEDRISGTRRALNLLQLDGIRGQKVFLKPNYNTGDPAPAATDTQLLKTLVQELQNAGAGQITVGDRSGMAHTRKAMQQKGLFKLADRYGLEVIAFDEMEANQWQYFSAEGTHWQQGFAFARPILEAEAVINTCCLKTHGGALYTLSLKNSVGMVAKHIPGDPFNYMSDLHTSPYMQQMVAEVNAAYQPNFVLVDGIEAFVKGGPEAGQKVPANVILAGTDRVAVDVVALGILRSLGTTEEVAQGSIWHLEQIRRAIELGLGAGSSEQIEIVASSKKEQEIADKIRKSILV